MNAVTGSVQRWSNAALALLYPEACQLCGVARATPEECFLCADCRKVARFIEPPFCERCGLPAEGAITTRYECSNCQDIDWQFRSARSAVVAGEKVLELIHRYKYQRALWFEPFLAELLIAQAKPELSKEPWTWIVPIPLYPARKREREFNQAERLSDRLSGAIGVPVNRDLLKRVLPTRTQTKLTRQQRLINVRNAFAVKRGTQLQGEKIVLVDDVLTTGATSNACARVLRAAGAGEVCVWTVARGI